MNFCTVRTVSYSETVEWSFTKDFIHLLTIIISGTLYHKKRKKSHGRVRNRIRKEVPLYLLLLVMLSFSSMQILVYNIYICQKASIHVSAV